MTPIEKNIRVVDDQGNEFEATYPKRAKGLVKNGRARFIDENTICLTCPPKIMEDITMSENIVKENIEQTVVDSAAKETEGLTAKEIFLKITEIQKQLTEPANNSLGELTDAVVALCKSGAVSDTAVQLICDVYTQREASIQKILKIYERMYADMQRSEDSLENAMIKEIYASSDAFTKRVFEMIANNKSGGPGDVDAQANGQALQELMELIREHEATNQEIIDFYKN